MSIVALPGARTLAWQQGRLVDPLAGLPDAEQYDHYQASPCGRAGLAVQSRGTRGLLLHGRHTRPLTRDAYQAHLYPFPAALGTTSSGQLLLAHAPERYDTLELQDALSGEALTRRGKDRAEVGRPDIFHSRLAFSPDARFLLSAGWVWHPFQVLGVYDVTACLNDPARLDDFPAADDGDDGEVEAAVFLNPDRSPPGVQEPDQGPAGQRLAVHSLGEKNAGVLRVRDWPQGAVLARSSGFRRLGQLLAFGPWLLSLYGHPRLLDPASGQVRAEWPDVPCGHSSTALSASAAVASALDPEGGRFAVLRSEMATVIQLEI